MSDRATLHKNRLADFIAWAEKNGFKVLPKTANPYEKFRLLDRKSRVHVGYERGTGDHITVTGDVVMRAVRDFLRASKANA